MAASFASTLFGRTAAQAVADRRAADAITSTGGIGTRKCLLKGVPGKVNLLGQDATEEPNRPALRPFHSSRDVTMGHVMAGGALTGGHSRSSSDCDLPFGKPFVPLLSRGLVQQRALLGEKRNAADPQTDGFFVRNPEAREPSAVGQGPQGGPLGSRGQPGADETLPASTGAARRGFKRRQPRLPPAIASVAVGASWPLAPGPPAQGASRPSPDGGGPSRSSSPRRKRRRAWARPIDVVGQVDLPVALNVHVVRRERAPKRLDPALEAFVVRPPEARIRCFWDFVIQAVRGEGAEETLCQEYILGGILPLIGDVATVMKEVLIPWHGDVGEQFWRTMVVVWLGAGGPGFQSFRHITDGTLLCGEECPKADRLPNLNSTSDVDRVYAHLRRIAEKHGRSKVLSGDGRCVCFRFSETQGIGVLRAWRQCVRKIVAGAGGTLEGLAALGPVAIAEHLRSAPWFGDLAAKELFCYLYPAHPTSFDVEVFLPVGAGAIRGGKAVLGISDDAADWHDLFRRMAATIPADLGARLSDAIRARAVHCPFRDDQRVPGAAQQLARARATAADVEVCMCFFMNFLKAKHRGSAPASWAMLKRSCWCSGAQH